MDFLLNISPLIKLLVIFVVIIVLIRIRLSLGAALTVGSVLLGLWFGLSLLKISGSMFGSLIKEQAVILYVVVTLILALSHSMEKTGQMKRLLDSFGGISQNLRLNLALFPALIGLLPMPGGAIFSAPLVHEISNRKNLVAEHKTVINYWFRHVWEFSWPLYPGVILTCALSGIDLGTFVLVQFPLTLFTAWVGYMTQLRPIRFEDRTVTPHSNKAVGAFLLELMPILLVIGGALFFGTLIYLAGNKWVALKSVEKEIPLIAALVISIFWVWRQNRMAVAVIREFYA